MKPRRRSGGILVADRETEIQRRIVKLYRSLGATVYVLSQARRSNQSPGLPDLIVKHGPRKLSWSHESKAEDGRVSDSQEEFARLCGACGDLHVIGGYAAAVNFLKAHGLVAAGWEPV